MRGDIADEIYGRRILLLVLNNMSLEEINTRCIISLRGLVACWSNTFAEEGRQKTHY
jgi:hypothetical protein